MSCGTALLIVSMASGFLWIYFCHQPEATSVLLFLGTLLLSGLIFNFCSMQEAAELECKFLIILSCLVGGMTFFPNLFPALDDPEMTLSYRGVLRWRGWAFDSNNAGVICAFGVSAVLALQKQVQPRFKPLLAVLFATFSVQLFRSYIGNVYGARVTAFSHGSQICFGNKYAIHGSSLPDPGDYPVILAGSYYFQRGQHFGTLANIFFNSKLSPALILNAGAELNGKGRGGAVPTINVNRSPLAGDNFGLHQATEIHVHTGLSQTLRGSSGCLTIEPDEAKAFFDSKISFYGTIHIMRPVQKS